jgi:TolB protein
VKRFPAAAAAIPVWLALAAPAPAAFPGLNGKIVFDRDDGLFLVDPDGTGIQRLTRSKQFDFAPSFSPDGEQLVFERDFATLYVVSVRGGKPRRLTDRKVDCCAAFAPGGHKIAFSRELHNSSEIFTMRLDGTHLFQVTHAHHASEAFNEFPAFSPKGGRIAFDRAEIGRGIFAVDNDGGHLKRLTQGEFDVSPNWSPDGRRIVFSHGTQISVMNADGTHRHRLTHDGFDNQWPVFSPNGRKIAYVRFTPESGARDGIFMMNADGSHVRRVTYGASGKIDWQPVPGPEPAP